MKFHFPKCSVLLSSDAEILNKHLYCCHLVPYHSVKVLKFPHYLTIPVSAHTSQVRDSSNLLLLSIEN